MSLKRLQLTIISGKAAKLTVTHWPDLKTQIATVHTQRLTPEGRLKLPINLTCMDCKRVSVDGLGEKQATQTKWAESWVPSRRRYQALKLQKIYTTQIEFANRKCAQQIETCLMERHPFY